MGRRTGVSALLEWALAFALLPLVVMSVIGVFLVPVAIAVLVVVGLRNRAWPYLPLGVVTGVGALVTVIGLMHAGNTQCRTAGTSIGSATGSAGVRVVGRGGCGLDGRRWLAVGGIVAIVGLTGYAVSSREHAAGRSAM